MKLPICNLSSPTCMVVHLFIYVNNNYIPGSFYVCFMYVSVKWKVWLLKKKWNICHPIKQSTSIMYASCMHCFLWSTCIVTTCIFNVTWRYRDFFVTFRTFMNNQYVFFTFVILAFNPYTYWSIVSLRTFSGHLLLKYSLRNIYLIWSI